MTCPHLSWSLFSHCGQRRAEIKRIRGGVADGEVADDKVGRPMRLKWKLEEERDLGEQGKG